MKFKTTLLQARKTATGIEEPPQVVASLGPSKKPKVRVTINGYTWRSSVATMGGKFMIGVSAEVREKAKVEGGDTVEVGLALDDQPRVVTVPPDFGAALSKAAAARKFFEGLSYSNQLRWVLSVEGAKTEETRQRRIAKAVESLAAGKK